MHLQEIARAAKMNVTDVMNTVPSSRLMANDNTQLCTLADTNSTVCFVSTKLLFHIQLHRKESGTFINESVLNQCIYLPFVFLPKSYEQSRQSLLHHRNFRICRTPVVRYGRLYMIVSTPPIYCMAVWLLCTGLSQEVTLMMGMQFPRANLVNQCVCNDLVTVLENWVKPMSALLR